jgi:tol-pal system protein YbgF
LVKSPGLVVLVASLSLGACAAPQRRMAADRHRLSVEVAELRAQARADRRAIKDLENRLALAAAAAAPEPLIVQDAPSATPEGEPVGVPDRVATGLYDEDGAEIVYEGEAAAPTRGARPRLTLHERSARDDEGLIPAPERAPIILPEGAGELPVTRGAVPTVDAHVRRARSAPLRASRPADPPRAEYERYVAALKVGNHAYAVAGLRAFIERYPDDDIADNAQYWLGESYYDQKDYQTAGGEFQKVLDRYPRGNKVADAMLKLGFCHAALGKLDRAREVLRHVVEQYPKTSPARLASERLASLERNP